MPWTCSRSSMTFGSCRLERMCPTLKVVILTGRLELQISTRYAGGLRAIPTQNKTHSQPHLHSTEHVAYFKSFKCCFD